MTQMYVCVSVSVCTCYLWYIWHSKSFCVVSWSRKGISKVSCLKVHATVLTVQSHRQPETKK